MRRDYGRRPALPRIYSEEFSIEPLARIGAITAKLNWVDYDLDERAAYLLHLLSQHGIFVSWHSYHYPGYALLLSSGYRRLTAYWWGEVGYDEIAAHLLARCIPEAVGEALKDSSSKMSELARKLAQLCLNEPLYNGRDLGKYDPDNAGSVMLDGSLRYWVETVVEARPTDEDYKHFIVTSTRVATEQGMPRKHPRPVESSANDKCEAAG